MNFKSVKLLLAGLMLTLSSVANASIIFSEDFDPITGGTWTISNGVVFGSGNAEFYDNNALYFNGSGLRSANTTGFDLLNGDNISFFLRQGQYPSTTYFEGADGIGEAIDFSYSTNGVDYMTIFTFDPAAAYDGSWTQFSFSLTAAMKTASTSFRWQQRSNSGSSFDHWAIDNVTVSSDSVNVPEPSSLLILALGMLGFGARRIKK